jgi:hypothetical protein
MDMDLDANYEFDEMIYEVAINAGTPKQRAQRGAKGLSFLEASHVPERLANDLKSLKDPNYQWLHPSRS